jgi:hypothetical protein
MKWLKTTMSFKQYTSLQDKFCNRLIRLPRPQKSFMYIEENDINVQNKTESVYVIYLTPDCILNMKDLIDEYHFTFCERPIRESVIGLCTIKDYEDSVWN